MSRITNHLMTHACLPPQLEDVSTHDHKDSEGKEHKGDEKVGLVAVSPLQS